MAEVKFPKGTEEWQMFTDFWKLCQAFWIPEDTDEYWEKLNLELKKIKNAYKDVPLVRGMAAIFGIKCAFSKKIIFMDTVLGFLELFFISQMSNETDEYWKNLHDEIEKYVKELPTDDTNRKIREKLAVIAMSEAERKFKEGKT